MSKSIHFQKQEIYLLLDLKQLSAIKMNGMLILSIQLMSQLLIWDFFRRQYCKNGKKLAWKKLWKKLNSKSRNSKRNKENLDKLKKTLKSRKKKNKKRSGRRKVSLKKRKTLIARVKYQVKRKVEAEKIQEENREKAKVDLEEENKKKIDKL
jgi:hypothetical protein